MNYRTQTIAIGGGTVTVRESVGADIIDASALYPKLAYSRQSKRQLNRAQRFANAFIRSEVEGNIGFSFPDFDAPDVEIQAAFEGWLALSPSDMAAWEVALNEVNKVAADPNATAEKAAEPS